MKRLVVGSAIISAIWFPWPLTTLLALSAAVWEPLVPLAIGLLIDMLYYSTALTIWPRFTILGAVVSAVALFVHTRLRLDMMD